jgi:ABC-type transporter Mla MlaB component
MTGLSVSPEGARLLLAGPMTFETVPQIVRMLDGIPPRLPVVVDLSRAGEADSAALSFFVEIVRRTRARGGSVTFERVPEAIRRIAAVYELEGVISEDSSPRAVV